VDGAAVLVLAEEPLGGAFDQDGVGDMQNGTLEGEVDAEDGAVGEAVGGAGVQTWVGGDDLGGDGGGDAFGGHRGDDVGCRELLAG